MKNPIYGNFLLRIKNGMYAISLITLLIIQFLISANTLSAQVNKQNIKVSGTVITASTKVPAPGVTVYEKGTTTGTITDQDGKYSISVSKTTAILVFSFIGYETVEATLNGKTLVDVALNERTEQVDEVVVVGYGVQKKVNLTGSITTIKTEELKQIPMPTISQSIMGRSPGLFIKNQSGQPGDESAVSLNIRGFGTPLIIIDGVPATNVEFEQLNPNDIEDFSVLKDAAAASVYGARAGNGVILVTTRRGAISKPKVTLSSSFQSQHFLVIPKFVNSEQYASMENLANFNQGLAPIWTAEQIQKFKDGSDPIHYPNVDWWNKAIRKSAPQTQQNITIQGGNEKVKYFVSGGYFYQEAMPLANETKNKRYNLRSNIDIALTNKLKVNLDLSALYQDYFGPINEMERTSAHGGIMNDMFRSRPYYPFAFPDATKVPGGRQDPYYKSFSDVVGYKKWNRLNTDAKVSFAYDLPLGFKLKANFHINKENYSNKEKDKKTPTYTYNWDTDVYTLAGYTNTNQKIYDYSSNSTRFDQQYFLSWNKKMENHNVSAMVVYELLSDDNSWINASRTGYNVNIDYLFAGPILNLTNGGSASEGGRKGIISRLNYDYKGKYLLELNARNDASPKFPKETRWGFFPSASVGWRISEEEFIKKNLPILTNLKLRASYGKLGFDNTGNFQYLSTYAIASQYIFDGSTNVVSSGILADALANNQITWEKMTSKNIGLDFKLGNHFDGTFDYFYRLRTDVLGSRLQSVPNVVGAIMPQVNYAKYDNRGWELALSYYNDLAGIHYSIGGNISRNREKSVFVDQAAFTNEEERRRGNRIGEWTDNFWGLKSDGLFQSKEEINGWADQDGKNNATILPGDIKYIDNNGDGKITNDDQIIIGRGIFPKLMFGVNMSLDWKGIDFSMLWQGAGDYDIDMRNAPDFTNVFYSGDSPMTQMLDAYTPPNPWLPTNTTNATFPLYRTDSYNRNHPNRTLVSDFWLINGSYVRLKNIELGYTLPKGLTGKLGIERCKVYVAAYNLLTFSANKFMDPEMKTNTTAIGGYYPPVGTYNIGLSLEF